MARIYDPKLTLKIVNEMINYDRISDQKLSGIHSTNTNRKNGYLAYDMNGEELGIIYENDDAHPKKPDCYKCAEILFFENYSISHNLGIWRIIVPIDLPRYVKRYIPFDELKQILSEKGSLTVTTKPSNHAPRK